MNVVVASVSELYGGAPMESDGCKIYVLVVNTRLSSVLPVSLPYVPIGQLNGSPVFSGQ